MTNQLNFKSLAEALEVIDSSVIIDNRVENSVVFLLQRLDLEERWLGVEALLTNSRPKVRVLGLRVVRRNFREQVLLEKVIQLSFSVDRLAELQYWYTAILSRYSVTRFGRELCKEMESRADTDFSARHIRALEMHQAKGSKAKKIVLGRLRGLAIERGWIEMRNT